ERNRFPRDLEDLSHFIEWQVHPLRDFLPGRFASEFLYEMSRRPDELFYFFDHVHRDTDRSGLFCNFPGNHLPESPEGIGTELIPAFVLELIHRLHQTDVSLLNQIQELEPAVRVLFGYTNHQP